MIPRMNLRSTAIIFLLPTTTVSTLVILQDYLQQTHKGKQQTNCAANTSYRFYIVSFYTLSFLSFLFSFYVALSSSSLESFFFFLRPLNSAAIRKWSELANKQSLQEFTQHDFWTLKKTDSRERRFAPSLPLALRLLSLSSSRCHRKRLTSCARDRRAAALFFFFFV